MIAQHPELWQNLRPRPDFQAIRVRMSFRTSSTCSAFLICMVLPLAVHARTIVYEGTMRNQTVQESARARLKLNIEGNKVTGYWTTYPPLQGSGSVSGTYGNGRCELSVVVDEDAVMELRGSCREDGFDGGYQVTIEAAPPQRGSFLLKPVGPLSRREALSRGTTQLAATTETLSAQEMPRKGVGGFENAPPIGDYGVYQHTGTLGYDFLYRLRFLNDKEYVAYDSKRGIYTYDPKTRQFIFLSGTLSAYTGQYFTQEKGGLGIPKIVLRLKSAPTPSESSAILRDYLYAFFRPEGIQ
jgi:hypothetical protein